MIGAWKSEGGCPCWVKNCGAEAFVKWFERARMLGRAVVVMDSKKFCMSMIRRAVLVLGAIVITWASSCVDVECLEMLM